LDVDTCPIAGLAVGVDGAPVPHRLERLDALDHDFAAGLPVRRPDATHAAGGILPRRVVEDAFRPPPGIAAPRRDGLRAALVLAHLGSPHDARASVAGAAAPAAR